VAQSPVLLQARAAPVSMRLQWSSGPAPATAPLPWPLRWLPQTSPGPGLYSVKGVQGRLLLFRDRQVSRLPLYPNLTFRSWFAGPQGRVPCLTKPGPLTT